MNSESEVNRLNQLVLELAQAHGYEAAFQGKEVLIGGRILCSVVLFGQWPMADGRVSIQLDFFVKFEKRQIKQSLAGWGKDMDEAISMAFENFNRSTLHTVLAAFFPEKHSDISVEIWNIAGKNWKVCFDSIVYFCADPETQVQLKSLPLFDTLKKCVENKQYSEKINWLSFFVNGTTLEVLLNNEIWKEGLEAFQKVSWPQTGQYFSARIFVIFIEE